MLPERNRDGFGTVRGADFLEDRVGGAPCRARREQRRQTGTAIFVTHASDNLITHNLIDDFYYSGITLGYIWGYKGSPSQRNEVSFNRISRIGQDELYDLASIYTLSARYGTVVSNNVISKGGAYSDVVDPLFVDAKNGDFRLKPDSPALKLGFREWDHSLAGPHSEPTICRSYSLPFPHRL